MRTASIIQDTMMLCMRVIHIQVTLFGWGHSHTFRNVLAEIFYPGHVPCCVGLADTVRSRENSWNGTEYAPRL